MIYKDNSPYVYKQRLFNLMIYKDNSPYGEITIPDLPLTNNGDDQTEFDITFTLNSNGCLSALLHAQGDDDEQRREIKLEIKHDPNQSDNKKEEKEAKDDDDDDDGNDIRNECQLFFKNVSRFVLFNIDKFLEIYSRQQVDFFINEAKQKEENECASEAQNIDELREYYKNLFKKYFIKHNVPFFLR